MQITASKTIYKNKTSTRLSHYHIFNNNNNYLLKLNNHKFLVIEKKPKRPEPFGNPVQLFSFILGIFLSFVAIFLLLGLFALTKAIYYLNFIMEQRNDFKIIFKNIIDNEKFYYLIIYMICIVVQFDILNKLIKHFFGLDFSIFKLKDELLVLTEEIMGVFRTYNLNEKLEIKSELLRLISAT